MNIFSKFYCRVFQMIMRFYLPLLPYREPKILKDNDAILQKLQEKNLTSILLVTDKNIRLIGLTKSLEECLTSVGINVSVYDNTKANPTIENVDEAVEIYKQNACQALIGFGGGSAIDCAKAVGACIACPNKKIIDMKGLLKVNHKLPTLIAIPTTAGSGSEATVSMVITDSETHQKYPISDFDLIPHYAMLDANLTLTLTKNITATTGMDALTHAMEAYIGRSTTHSTRKNSLRAIKLIFENLQTAYENGNDLEARKNMLKASHLAGKAFTKSYVGYVHAISHSLGGKYDLPHGLTNAIVLPFMLKEYGKSIYKKLWKIGVYCELFDNKTSYKQGANIVIDKIENMNKTMNITNNLNVIKDNDIPELARTAAKESYPLYPVPKLYNVKQLQKIYYKLKQEN